MLIFGANINTSEEHIDAMIEERDATTLLDLARYQIQKGAVYISVNCGTRVDTEPQDIEWMVETIQQELAVPMCIDSPCGEAQKAGLAKHRYGRPMVNSITAEPQRIATMLPMVKKYDALVTALLHDESGMPTNVQDRLSVMPKLQAAFEHYGISPSDVYLDCLVFPLATDHLSAQIYFETHKQLRLQYPRFKTICGLNNISYGLPSPDILDCTFLSQCAAAGQEAAFVRLSETLAAFIPGIELVEGNDEFALNYIASYRSGMVDSHHLCSSPQL
jgi:cobalamin-dependent methionine synthase I